MGEIDYQGLIQQVSEWNRWRAEHPEQTPDLSQAYLLEADLRKANLRDVNLSRACLIDANLQEADLSGANLEGIYGDRANFQAANLAQAQLSQAKLIGATLTNANLTEAVAQQTQFIEAELTGICIQNWQIDTGSNFADARCRYVYLDGQHARRLPSEAEFTAATFQAFVAEQLGLNRDEGAYSPPPTGEPAAAALPTVAPVPGGAQTSSDSKPSALRFGILSAGLAAIAVVLGGVISLRPRSSAPPQVSLSNVELSSLPCQEPPPLPLPGQPDFRYRNGVEYYGDFDTEAGIPVDGRGTMIFANGDRYDGEFQDGDRSGCGTFTFANGRQYMGQFRSDTFDGIGVWQMETGDRYVGQFRDNKCEGWGTFLFADGSSQSGTWENGTLVGDTLTCDHTQLSDSQ
ncbi:MAG: pentapeptide repeat-containing protein [Cyanobacteria bacterium P01_H01_bin.119]